MAADKFMKIAEAIAAAILLLITVLLAATFLGFADHANDAVITFANILFDNPFAIPACLILLPALLWKRSVFIMYSLTVGLLVIAVWTMAEWQEHELLQKTGYVDMKIDDFIGWAIFMLLGISYVAGLVVRLVVHAFVKRMWPRIWNYRQ